MPTATLRPRDGLGPCPNCGREPAEHLDVVTAKGHVAFVACKGCWPVIVRRGQVETVAALCRLADEPPRRTPEEILR